MKKYTYILFSLVLLISSCRECKDCIMILEMDAGITNAMLDSIAQTVNNDHVYTGTYLSWEEYVTDPGNTPQEELITFIYLPVEKK